MSTLTPAEVRSARAFLRKRGIGSGQVSPRRFAAAAKEKGDSFSELLKFIMRMYQGAQNQSSQQREVVKAAASQA